MIPFPTFKLICLLVVSVCAQAFAEGEYDQFYEQYYQQQQGQQPQQPVPQQQQYPQQQIPADPNQLNYDPNAVQYPNQVPVDPNAQPTQPESAQPTTPPPSGEDKLHDQQQYDEQWKAYEEQQADAWRQFYRLPAPPVQIKNDFGKSSPAISLNIPTGFGPNWGDIYGTLIYLKGSHVSPVSDGVAAGGFGLGNGRKSIGFGATLVVTDLIGTPFADGFLTFKLHKQFSDTFAVSLGANGHLGWGNNEAIPSFNFVVTKMIFLKESEDQWFNSLSFTAGAGTGNYASLIDVIEGRPGFGIFGGISVRVNRPFSIILNYVNANIDAGFSYAPFETFPLTFSAGLNTLMPLPDLFGKHPLRNMIPFISASLGLALDQQSFSF